MTSSTQHRAPVIGRMPRAPEPTVVSHEVRTALAASLPLTVLRSARGFGKTATLAAWLRHDAGTTRTIYYPLDPASNHESGFWAGLADVLVEAGVIPESSTPDNRAHVRDSLASTSEPVRVVLDNYHEAGLSQGGEQIDEDLIDLLRRNDRLYLVVAGRATRTLESLGPLSIDTVVIGPRELRLRGEQVRHLAERSGLDLSIEAAERLSTEFGGWPAPIRAVILGMGAVGSDPADLDRHALVMGYVGAVVRDLRFGNIRAFLLRTAVPDSFDVDLLRVIAPRDIDGLRAQDGPAIAAHLRSVGLLQVTRTEGAQQYRYAPGIRHALLQVMSETCPEVGREVHRALLTAPGADYDAGQALTHAVRAEEWATALDLIDRQWFALLIESPVELVEAARRIPAPYNQGNPRVRMAREHLAAIVGRMEQRTIWVVPEGLLSRSDVAGREFEGAADHVDQEVMVLLQWAVASLLGGHHDAAIYAFNQVRELGMGRHHRASVLGASGLALVHALAGQPDLAETALSDEYLQSYLDDDVVIDSHDMPGVTVRIVQAFIAIDRGEPAAAQKVRAIVDPWNRAELWVLAEFARAHYAAYADDPQEVFRQANHLRASLRHIAKDTLAETVLQSVLVELQLIARMVGVAGEVADNLGSDPIARTAQAKVHHARQDYDRAIAAVHQALAAPDISARSRMEATVLLASSLHGKGAQAAAREAFRDAVHQGHATGQRRPFQLMHRYVFDMLVEHAPRARQLWPGGAPVAPTEHGGVADVEELPTLTMREAQILRALERHAGPVGIAGALGLSPNTVKTHLRAVYRKLGVTSRNEALEAAGGGGLDERTQLSGG